MLSLHLWADSLLFRSPFWRQRFWAGMGWFTRRYWGWILGVSLIALVMIGDLVNILRGESLKGIVGTGVAGLLLVYTTRLRVRNYFYSEQPFSVSSKL